jgi:hypothetical protein
MDFPEHVTAEAFERNFVPGAIFLCEDFRFDDGSTRDKYLVVLSRPDTQGYVRFFLATSQVNDLKHNPILSGDCLFIGSGDLECFDRETAINTRTVFSRPYVDLKERFLGARGAGALVFKCHLDRDRLEKLWELIVKSRHIPLGTKFVILPDHLKSSG